jgi:hypothetical protein
MVKFRRRGLGTKILEILMEETDVYWAITMTDANRRNRMKAGCREGKAVDHYFKVIGSLDKASYILSITKQDQVRNRIIRSLLGCKFFTMPVYYFVNCILRQKASKEQKHDFHFKKIEQFDTVTEKLWLEVSTKYDFTTHRSSSYLNWRYAEHPFINYEIYKLQHDASTIGFFVFRIGPDPQRAEAYITELLVQADFEHAVPVVLNFIEHLAKNKNVDNLYISSSLHSIKMRIEECGFYFFKREMAVFAFQPHIQEKIDADSIVSDKAVWFMSRGDQELDIYNNELCQPGALVLVKVSLRVLLRKLSFWSRYRNQGFRIHEGS